jgi:hypothetical protein
MKKKEQSWAPTHIDIRHTAAVAAVWLVLGGLLSLFLAVAGTAQTEGNRPFTSPVEADRSPPGSALQELPAADADKPGLVLEPQTVAIAEAASQPATYEVALASEPSAPVIVTIETDGQSWVDLGVLVFEKGTWDRPQQVKVRAVDDTQIEGLHESTITHRTSSLDRKYDNLQPATLTALIEDNDTAGFEVSPRSLEVAEPDGTAAFTATLRSEPAASVSLTLAVSSDACSVQPPTLSLDSNNWQGGARATVLAVDNPLVDGERTCTVLTGPAESQDPIYDGWDPEDVTVTVLDDDQAQILVQPTALTISEPNGSAIVTLTLTSRPAFTVAVPLSTSNGQCSVLPGLVTQEEDTWQNQIRVVVTAVDDDERDSDQVCIVQTGPVRSEDVNYDGYDPEDVTVTVRDDERGWQAYLPNVYWLWPPLPGRPVLEAIDNADGDGTYILRWNKPQRAQNYILQEGTNNAFAGASNLYSGPETSFAVERRGASHLFYRVRATNGAGESDWSNTEEVDVLWELEPNDEPKVQSNGPLAAATTYFGLFGHASDVNDYFYVELPSDSAIEISLTNIPAGYNHDLVLRDAALNRKGYSGELGNQDEQIVKSLAAGRYYIQVFNRSETQSNEAYHLLIEY